MDELTKIKDFFVFAIMCIIFYDSMKSLDTIYFISDDQVIWLVGYCAAYFIIMPPLNRLQDRNFYVWANSKTDYNPLYIKGYFRKHAGRSYFWSDFKGMYHCQLAVMFLMAMIWGCVICNRKILKLFYSDKVIAVMGIIFWMLFLAWSGFRIYYCRCYNEAFRYTQNAEGIWQPYSNIAKRHGWGDYRPFKNLYYVRYKNMQDKLRISCPASGYQYVDSYEMHNAGDRTDIYIKRMETEIRIFQLVHLREYTEDAMKQLNDIFADFWKTYVGKNDRVENAAVLFLLCVEEYNKELKERLLSVCSVDQKKGRNRVAAVLTYYGKPSLEILESYGIFRERKRYKELRGELLRLLGMSEKNNHKSYGNREEYGPLKEISEARDEIQNFYSPGPCRRCPGRAVRRPGPGSADIVDFYGCGLDHGMEGAVPGSSMISGEIWCPW